MPRPLRPAANSTVNSTANSTANSAFTLMELLVVISIIMILMGMLFAGISLAKESAARAKTQATMTQLVAACESYRQVNGKYPQNTESSATLAKGFNDADAFGTSVPYNKPYNDPSLDWKYINGALVSALNAAGESFKDPVLDAWKMPIRYRPAFYYPYLTTSGAARIDGENPPNRDSFQLWSIGKDKIDQGGDSNSDDLVSWTN
jgi:type II secretory pathway pseudopilin PulG